jgi:hypothetical protein
VIVVPLLNKDRLEMTGAAYQWILATVRGLLYENAPVNMAHGTDTSV